MFESNSFYQITIDEKHKFLRKLLLHINVEDIVHISSSKSSIVTIRLWCSVKDVFRELAFINGI